MRKVGIIGAGYFGQFHINAWERLNVDLVGIMDPGKPDCLPDLDALLALKPDIIDITSPPDTHLGLIKVLEGRVPAIICQKPFCGGLSGAQEAIKATRKSRLLVHENIRFQPWYTALNARMSAGDIGETYHATFRFRPGDGQGPEAYLARQPYFQTMPRFLVHETAVHWIDTFRALFGEMTSVSAHLTRLNPAIAGEDACLLHFTFQGGQTAVFDGNRLSDHRAEDTRLTLGEMVIEGSAGTLFLDGDANLSHRPHGAPRTTPIAYPLEKRDFGGNCVELTCAHLLDAIQHRTPSPLDADKYLRNLEIVEAIYESAASGRRIDLQ